MKRFHYSLAHLLSLRRHAEREAEMELAAILSRKGELESRLGELRNELQAPIVRSSSGALDIAGEQARAYYRLRMERETARLSKELRAVESELEAARTTFSEKRKARQVLERLREVREAEHLRLEHKREESELNDIIGSRAARVQSSGGAPWQGDITA